MIKNIKNKYTKTKVKLDNNEFVKCSFDECTVEYAGTGPVSMIDCTFTKVQWVFVDGAQQTLQFLQGLYHGMGEGGRTLVESTFDNIRQSKPISEPSSVNQKS
jgi:hypothetical protein